MSNTSLRRRPLTRVAAGLATAAAVLVPILADGGAVLAGGFEPVPFDRPTIDLPAIDPKIDVKPVEGPLPCHGWWCSNPSIFQQPDYVATYDNDSSVPRKYDGVIATPYYVTVYNNGSKNPGEVYSTIAARGGEILAVEGVGTTYPDLQVEPVSNTATETAPLALSYLDDAWILHDTDGYEVGFSNRHYLRVWVTGTGNAELVVGANEHAGVDLLGTPGLDGYRQAETNRSNNRVSFTV